MCGNRTQNMSNLKVIIVIFVVQLLISDEMAATLASISALDFIPHKP
jgi:hypothetical protein